jgi:LPS O-antigen subunit length determinant protein (WzzB/FepE family)
MIRIQDLLERLWQNITIIMFLGFMFIIAYVLMFDKKSYKSELDADIEKFRHITDHYLGKCQGEG